MAGRILRLCSPNPRLLLGLFSFIVLLLGLSHRIDYIRKLNENTVELAQAVHRALVAVAFDRLLLQILFPESSLLSAILRCKVRFLPVIGNSQGALGCAVLSLEIRLLFGAHCLKI